MQGGGDAVSRAPALDESLARAHQLAVAQGHAAVALEHLLFALTDDSDAVAILSASRISVEQLRTDVSGHLGRISEAGPGDAGAAPRPGADLLRILQLAGMAARQSQRRMMDGGIVLAAIIGDGNSPAAGLLKAHGLTFEDVIRVLQTSGPARQQEISAPPVRAELPPPTPAPPPAPVSRQVANAGDDALAAARARVRHAEPAAMKPYVPAAPTPPEPSVGAGFAQSLPPQSLPVQSLPVQSLPVQDVRPTPPHVPLAQQSPAEPRVGQRPPVAEARPDLRSEPRHDPLPYPHPELARVPSLPAEPVTIPVTAPVSDQALARLRPTAPSAAPQPPTEFVPPPVAPRPMAPPPQPRAVPAVVPRSPAPYPIAPPPRTADPWAYDARPHGLHEQRPPSMPQRPDLPPVPAHGPGNVSGHGPGHPQAPLPLPPPFALLPSEPLEIVHAAAGLPAIVRRNTPVLVEIRIPRAQVDVPRQGPNAAYSATIVRAVTTRLTGGAASGLSIEPRTPETTWLGPADADNRDVIWQYVLLPTRTGTFGVTLSVAGRTLSPVGMLADASTAAETFAVRVKPQRGRFWRRLAGTLLLLALGGAIGWALTGPLAGTLGGLIKALLDVARG